MLWKRILGGGRRGAGEREARPPARLVLYSRPDCHLCDVMKAEIAAARTDVPYTLAEVDVDSDPELTERYGLSIPVLEIEGRAAFKGRLTSADFARKLARRYADAAGASA